MGAERGIGEAVLGITDPADADTSLVMAYETLSGERLTIGALRAETERLRRAVPPEGPQALEDDERERLLTVQLLEHALTGSDRLRANVLNLWPFYQHLYEAHALTRQHEAVPLGQNNVLLLGCMTALSARAFTQLADEVYKADRSVYLDIRKGGRDKQRQGTFVQSDALHIPFRHESMHIVQTSSLFNWLGGSSEIATNLADKEADTRRVLAEMYRVLRPGGHLLLCETAIGFDSRDGADPDTNVQRITTFTSLLNQELAGLGFEAVTTEPAYTIPGVHYLFDRSRNFSRYASEPYTGLFGIYAHKPLRTEHADDPNEP